jgi:hypothetical protein
MRLRSKYKHTLPVAQLHHPGGFTRQKNVCKKIINAREQEEDIARQHSSIANEIFIYLLNHARDGASQHSFEAVMTDFLIVIRLLGLRVSEYAQTTQNEIDVHEYPSGKRVIKAFTPLDFIIHDKNNAIINEKNTANNLTVLNIRSSIMSHITFQMCQFVLIIYLRDYHYYFDLDIVVL